MDVIPTPPQPGRVKFRGSVRVLSFPRTLGGGGSQRRMDDDDGGIMPPNQPDFHVIYHLVN
jgi:hypothetical protein